MCQICTCLADPKSFSETGLAAGVVGSFMLTGEFAKRLFSRLIHRCDFHLIDCAANVFKKRVEEIRRLVE